MLKDPIQPTDLETLEPLAGSLAHDEGEDGANNGTIDAPGQNGDGDVNGNFENEAIDTSTRSSDQKQYLLEPPSWSEPVVIDKEAFDKIYPEGYKFQYFKRCNVEKYSRQRDGLNGLILKLTLFEDDERQKLVEIREIFSDRK